MADRFLIILLHAPYGRLAAAEAVRHLNGAAAQGLDATLLLLGDGVYLAKAGQAAASGWTDLAAALGQALGGAHSTHRSGGRAAVCVSAPDLVDRALDPDGLVPGCQLADEATLADLLNQADFTLVY
jgi:sulfur relay (sulfurtransferase) DsrF/TusC family protein